MTRESRRRIAIVTDSTSDLPSDLLKEYGVHVVPQMLMMEGKTWLDRVDIDPPAFYKLLRASSSFPTTSQPSRVDFQNRFTELSQEAEGIVAVLVSSEISGTVASALAAAEGLPDFPIEIVDSRGISLKLGFPVLAAAKAAAAGGDLQAVAEAARALVPKIRLYFVVGTLEYLHRGGRIGSASWLLGSALNLKPVLEFGDGTIHPVAKIRTRRKALERVYALIHEQLGGAEKVHMGVLNIDAQEEADDLAAQLVARFRPEEMFQVECSPVIGAHAGPGTVGVAFYTE
jgi:DegV family protein with EDD domain